MSSEKWQPVESAPTGEPVLTWHDFGRPVSNPAHPSYGKNGEVLVQTRMSGGSFDSELLSSGIVTHWMPLPSPPRRPAMSSDPIEVLRTLRDRYSHNRHAVLALDAAIASLSAPKPPPVNDNAVAVNESAPVNDKPESAEAVAWISQSDMDALRGVTEGRFRTLPVWTAGGHDIANVPLYTAPPRPEASAPVGVEAFESRLRGRAGPFTAQPGERYVDADIALAVLREALAQQTAAVAPVGVPVDVVREYLDARACYEAATRPPNSHARAPVLKHGDPVVLRLREARVALDNAIGHAQQPAAVDEAVTELRQAAAAVVEDHTDYSARVRLRAALAQQPAAVDGASYTRQEVAEAMRVLRGRNGSTALHDEVLDDMERVLTAALAGQQQEGRSE